MKKEFLQGGKKSKKRQLEGFRDVYRGINVARDVVDFSFVMKSDEDPDSLKYFLAIDDWSE